MAVRKRGDAFMADFMIKRTRYRGTFDKVRLSGETNERLRFQTKDEAQNLLAYRETVYHDEMYAFTVFALHCGARSGTIMDLRWNNFALNCRTALFIGGDKKSPPKTLPMSQPTIDAIKTMERLNPNSKGSFAHFKKDGKLRTAWDRMQEALGFDDVVVHTLRHTCASWRCNGGWT
ncbi:site-specific integrase [Rhizobium sp. SEMIA 4085]|uniref:site-specific integrase n=1 Tax=Rhizobium sp. SEMIA 4085 TaxID=2137761 RepID=UPI001478FC44|nr:site-specific integrase [Rhizobium sp. SEMIA 4085]NNH32954.1 site-specific integrase [Rhizobium sp. SEMIA 4085]